MHFNLFDFQGGGAKKEDHKKKLETKTKTFFQTIIAGYTS